MSLGIVSSNEYFSAIQRETQLKQYSFGELKKKMDNPNHNRTLAAGLYCLTIAIKLLMTSLNGFEDSVKAKYLVQCC